MTPLVPVICALLTALAFSGCTDTSPGPRSPADEAEAGSGEGLVGLPEWQVGDWWEYDFGGFRLTWVVSGDLGSDWQLSVDDADYAFSHVAFDEVSTLGAVSKAELAGSQDGGRVRFFDFPLSLGKTWDMTWDGAPWTAEVVDIEGPTAEVRATSGDRLRVYVLDAERGWFSSMAAYDENGTEEFTARLGKAGGNYGGTYAKWTLHDDYQREVTPGQPVIETFDVPDEATDLWFLLVVQCDPDGLEGDQGFGVLEIHPGPDSGGAAGISRQDVCPTFGHDIQTLEPTPGEWGVTAISGGARYFIWFMPRTYEEMRIP